MHTNLRPLRRLSLAGRAVAVAGALMMIAWPIAAGLNPALLEALLPSGVAAKGEVPWAVLWVSLIPAAMFLGAMVEAFRLFGMLGNGLAFTEAMPRNLERLGWWAVACAAAGLTAPTLVGLIATADAAEGQRQLIVRVGSGEIAGLVIALLLLAFARVMRAAVELSRENREFV